MCAYEDSHALWHKNILYNVKIKSQTCLCLLKHHHFLTWKTLNPSSFKCTSIIMIQKSPTLPSNMGASNFYLTITW